MSTHTQSLTNMSSRTFASKANRALMTKLSAIDQIVLDFEYEQIRTTENCLIMENICTGLTQGRRQFYDPLELSEKKNWAKTLSGDSKKTITDSLALVEKLGSTRQVAKAPSPSLLGQLLVDFPNFSEVTEFIQRRLTLNNCSVDRLLSLPPILLAGPAGVGKTAYSKRLASLLGVNFTEIDISSNKASFAITGLDTGYSNGRPGEIWNALNRGSGCMSCMMLLDEIDKSCHSRNQNLGFLYGLLEQESAKRFQDAATLLPIDASRIIWLATCNETSNLDSAILSRFEVIHVSIPTEIQMCSVVNSIQRELFKQSDWAVAFDESLQASIVSALSQHTPRLIRRTLEDAYAKAAQHGRRTLQICDIEFRKSAIDQNRRQIGFIQTKN